MSARRDAFTLGGELRIRRLGFGAMRLTGRGVWGEPSDPQAAREVLREAVGLGVEFIDTADSYGPGVSERLIAESLYPYPSGLVLATKGGYRRDGPWEWRPDGRPEHLRAACEGSLRRLRLDRIDLYYLHRIDPAVPLAESVGCLSELVQEGKIRYVGLSEVDLDALRTAQRVTPIAAVQNRYNLIERTREEVLSACEREDIAFVPWFPLGRGTLAGKRVGPLRRVAARRGVAPAQVALAWLLHRSPAIVPIPGTSSLEHLRENVAAVDIELGARDVQRLENARPPMQVPGLVRTIGKLALTRLSRT